jgi:hypothetical protein
VGRYGSFIIKSRYLIKAEGKGQRAVPMKKFITMYEKGQGKGDKETRRNDKCPMPHAQCPMPNNK